MGKEKAADGAKKEDKEPKAPKARVKESYDGDTTDAAVVAAARLTHMFSGYLKVDDILGYMYQIFLHIAALSISFAFAYIWLLDLERRQDPWERASVNFMTGVLVNFTTGANGVALSNITEGNNTSFSKADATAATYTLAHCGLVLNNFKMLHIFLLSIFMGTVITRTFKIINRVYILVVLPTQGYHHWEGYETPADGEEEKDELHYSMRNWSETKEGVQHSKIDHMVVIMKILTFLFIIIPDLLFTVCAMYTGVKVLGVSVGSPYKLAKQALKASFLFKFPKLYYTVFTAHNMKIYLVGGEYWIPKTQEEIDEEKERDKDLDRDGQEDLDAWDMWYSWGSFFAKVILGFSLSILWIYIKEAPKNDLEEACKVYRASNAHQAWENNIWTPTEFPNAPNEINATNIMQKIFYVPRS